MSHSRYLRMPIPIEIGIRANDPRATVWITAAHPGVSALVQDWPKLTTSAKAKTTATTEAAAASHLSWRRSAPRHPPRAPPPQPLQLEPLDAPRPPEPDDQGGGRRDHAHRDGDEEAL